jgi:inorganic pyrophosphatase
MQKAIMIGFAVMGGILLGRIQLVTNHEANDAIAAQAQTEQQLVEARAEARATKAQLAKLQHRFIETWRQLDPMLEDYVSSTGVVDRETARLRIEQLRWDMDVVEARLVATRQVHLKTWKLR